MPDQSNYRIAVIAGDGIGKEVMPEGVRALEAASSRFGRLFIDSGIVVLAGWLIHEGMKAQTAWVVGLGIAALLCAALVAGDTGGIEQALADIYARLGVPCHLRVLKAHNQL